MPYILSLQAEQQLADILENAARFVSEKRSEKLEFQFLEAFSMIAANPGLGHLRPDLVEDAFFFRVGEHMVLYDRYELPTPILAIYHGSRDVAAIHVRH